VNRCEIVRLLVLNAIADDYEEPRHIFETIIGPSELCGVPIQPKDVDTVLVQLVEMGLASAYELTPTAPAVEIQGVPRLDQVNRYYFFITKRGREVHATLNWPFDEEGALLPGWIPPSS
jgi:hypothetical protein